MTRSRKTANGRPSKETPAVSAFAGMRPYFEEAGITIYHADCRLILPHLTKVDVVITDIPYGVELGTGDPRGGKHGLIHRGYASYEDTYANYCNSIVPALTTALSKAKRGAVFCGPHFQELPKATALGGVYCPAGSGRHRWGFKTFLPVLFYGTAPNLNKGAAKPNTIQSVALAEKNEHPCAKPLAWLKWLVSLCCIETETILDPFMGSGTTLRAAKDLGRSAIGIDIEERYCETAAKRLQGELAAECESKKAKPEQQPRKAKNESAAS